MCDMFEQAVLDYKIASKKGNIARRAHIAYLKSRSETMRYYHEIRDIGPYIADVVTIYDSDTGEIIETFKFDDTRCAKRFISAIFC